MDMNEKSIGVNDETLMAHHLTGTHMYEKVLKNMLRDYREMYFLQLEENYYQRIYPNTGEDAECGSMEQAVERCIGKGILQKEDEEKLCQILHPAELQHMLKEENPIKYKYQRRTENGDYEWCLLCFTAEEWKNDIPVTAAMTIQSIHDVMQETSGYLSMMSHDIRTPLNVILGMSSLASTYQNDPERVKDCLEKINVSGKHLLSLVNDVLDMSKMENGKLELHMEQFSVMDMLLEIVSIAEGMISDKNQTFCFDLKNIVHETVIGDSHRLRQVLINIISNAVKYGKKEGVVNFCAEECEAKDAYRSVYRFIIRDNGRGMSQEFVQRIFEPFSREKTDETEKIDGSGLGMAIARQIVTQMGGTISLTSQLGIGSEFQIEIPLLIGEEKHAESFAQYEVLEQCEQIAATKSMDVKFAGIHALLVEDNEFNAEIAEEMLKMLGVSVVWAENGKEAVRIFSDSTEGEFDCIFMDIRMPGMDGMETTKWIRRLQRSDSNLPVFAMTANVFLEEVDKTKAAGMQDHIGKPISLPSVCQILTKWFPERIEKNTSIIKAFMI